MWEIFGRDIQKSFNVMLSVLNVMLGVLNMTSRVLYFCYKRHAIGPQLNLWHYKWSRSVLTHQMLNGTQQNWTETNLIWVCTQKRNRTVWQQSDTVNRMCIVLQLCISSTKTALRHAIHTGLIQAYWSDTVLMLLRYRFNSENMPIPELFGNSTVSGQYALLDLRVCVLSKIIEVIGFVNQFVWFVLNLECVFRIQYC